MEMVKASPDPGTQWVCIMRDRVKGSSMKILMGQVLILVTGRSTGTYVVFPLSIMSKGRTRAFLIGF